MAHRVLLLGSTGSIGSQVLDVARKHPDKIEIVGIACGTRIDVALSQAREFRVSCVGIGNEDVSTSESADALRQLCSNGELIFGSDCAERLIEACDADIVVNSLVGAQGLAATMMVLERGQRLALANKESLVVGGDLVMRKVRDADPGWAYLGEDARFRPKGALMPIDSEHGAIFQCLLGEQMGEVDGIWLTASGGPFRGAGRSELESVTCNDALAHPTWNMGPKITIDSATLMNKGLEVIEAHQLYGVPYSKIDVVVQPQSADHSMVAFVDGSVKAHFGVTDMRIPIQYALSYPARWKSPSGQMDFRSLGEVDFLPPDMDTFKCLSLAYQAGESGGTLPCVMNAANEVAVEAFLKGACSFLQIADCVESAMDSHAPERVESLGQLQEIDARARAQARKWIEGNA